MEITWKIIKVRKHPKTEIAKRVRLECEAKEGDVVKTRKIGVRIKSDDITKDTTDEVLLELAKETLGTERVTKIETRLKK